MVGRRRLALAAGILAAAGALGLVTPPALSASCVGPEIAVGASFDPPAPGPTPVPLTRGASITVAGEWFRDGCSEGGGTVGCGAPVGDQEAPQTGIALRLVQRDRSWTLATGDAGNREAKYAVRWTAIIPTDAKPGGATLEASGASTPVVIG